EPIKLVRGAINIQAEKLEVLFLLLAGTPLLVDLLEQRSRHVAQPVAERRRSEAAIERYRLVVLGSIRIILLPLGVGVLSFLLDKLRLLLLLGKAGNSAHTCADQGSDVGGALHSGIGELAAYEAKGALHALLPLAADLRLRIEGGS